MDPVDPDPESDPDSDPIRNTGYDPVLLYSMSSRRWRIYNEAVCGGGGAAPAGGGGGEGRGGRGRGRGRPPVRGQHRLQVCRRVLLRMTTQQGRKTN